MISIRRFTSFAEIQQLWIEFEQANVHYPFQSFWYQQLFAQTFCDMDNVYLLCVYDVGNGLKPFPTLLAIGGFEKIGDNILFLGMKQVLGGQDITDYGDLLWKANLTEKQTAEAWQAIIDYFKALDSKQIQLDFVREDSKTHDFFSSNAGNGLLHHEMGSTPGVKPFPTINNQEVSPYIVVPSSWDEYLASLERKQRHELKRKIKRFEEQHAFHFCSNETINQDFDTFIRLHRASDEAKEKFMSEPMKQFFWNIVSAEKTDYRIDFCFLEIDNHPVASIMSFIGQGKALLYNSGFDPAYRYYSVGVILHAYLIKKSIEEKLTIHDFLRGNERYKYNLGAQDMQLYQIHVPLVQ